MDEAEQERARIERVRMEQIDRRAFECRLVSISTVILDGKIRHTAVDGTGKVWEGERRGPDGAAILDWYPVRHTFHWYPLGTTPD